MAILWTGTAVGDPGGGATEFCLRGEYGLGVRLQGMRPMAGEFAAAEWCVVTEGGSERVHFRASGRSNPDLSGAYAVTYLPPDVVRIVNRDAPPELEFSGTAISEEARRNRRIDPRRLVEEIAAHPEWVVSTAGEGWRSLRYPGESVHVKMRISEGRLEALHGWPSMRTPDHHIEPSEPSPSS